MTRRVLMAFTKKTFSSYKNQDYIRKAIKEAEWNFARYKIKISNIEFYKDPDCFILDLNSDKDILGNVGNRLRGIGQELIKLDKNFENAKIGNRIFNYTEIPIRENFTDLNEGND